jgi:hypothetical protein
MDKYNEQLFEIMDSVATMRKEQLVEWEMFW